MSRILCVAVVVSGALWTWAGPALAGMSEGMAAVTVGDYPKAISEFQPLAASGDAAAQYQLARIYLEGHGPADGVPQGIDLMTKAANGNYPEAQAQLGLMYAMGLGVPVDNAKAYEWLNKAVAALPEGTRRTVAEANRDTVLKRMNGGQGAAVAAAAAPAPAATGDATKTQTAAAATTQPAPAKPASTQTAMAATAAKPATTQPAAAKPAATQVAAKPATPAMADPAPAKVTEAAKVESKPAKTEAKAPETTVAAAKTPAAEPAAKAPEPSTQLASAKAPDAAPAASVSASQQAAPSGVRIQLISMPSEEAAWGAWKQLSGKYSAQLTGLTAIVQPADLGAKGTFYRVQAGPFDSVTAAQDRCSAMKEAGLDCLVVGKP
jgi:hypothetical protein